MAREAGPAPGSDAPQQRLTALGAAFLGVGAMVGAGIFALLGQAGAVAGAAVWISFLLAGGIAALLGYVVVKLGVRYPSKGGFVAYLVEAFGNGRLVGITSWLLYFVVLIVTAMVAVAFGAYGTSLFFGDDAARVRRQRPHLRRRDRHGGAQPVRRGDGGKGAIGDRLGAAGGLRRLRRRDALPD